jgi:hypothetical protein
VRLWARVHLQPIRVRGNGGLVGDEVLPVTNALVSGVEAVTEVERNRAIEGTRVPNNEFWPGGGLPSSMPAG